MFSMVKKRNGGVYGKGGFTLVELLVAVALFTIVVFISLGAILTIFDANKRSQYSKTVVDNLNLTLEDMIRILRFGETYNCDPENVFVYETADCANGNTTMSVVFNGTPIIYRLNGTSIESSVGGGDFAPITAPDVVIEDLKFYVYGSSSEFDDLQPYAIIVIEGYVGNKPVQQARFQIQTIAVQRQLDIVD